MRRVKMETLSISIKVVRSSVEYDSSIDEHAYEQKTRLSEKAICKFMRAETRQNSSSLLFYNILFESIFVPAKFSGKEFDFGGRIWI